MKKYIPLLLILFVVVSLHSQHRKLNPNKKIDAARISYLTEHLELTSKQAEKFWPIYNTSRSEISAMYRQKNLLYQIIDFNTIEDDSSNALIKKINKIDDEIYTERKAVDKKLLKVLNSVQFLKLKTSEISFKRKLLERIKKNRGH